MVDRPEAIRNIAFVGHNDTGKTTLASALLYTGGVDSRLGRVEEGHAITDFDPEEVERGISIGLAVCYVPWKKHKINILDSPGYGIFASEMHTSLKTADAALICVNAVSGVEVTTEKAWQLAKDLGLPVLLHLNKMDRERADLPRVLALLKDRFGREAVPIQLPIGKEDGFAGVVDLVASKAFKYEAGGKGVAKVDDIDGELAETAEEWRNQLVEAVAETDDALMERYFEDGTLDEKTLRAGLKKALAERKIFPVTCGSAGSNIGSSNLLDVFLEIFPSPVDRGVFPAFTVGGEEMEVQADADASTAALVFKTMSDPFSGQMALFRVVQGTLKSDTPVWNTQREEMERVGQLLHVQGKQGTGVNEIVAGDIGGVAKLKHTRTGDTLCDKGKPCRLGWIRIPEPAISFALEPKSKGDEEKISEAMARLMDEDVTLRAGRDPETGELLLSGTGQLHVEIAVSKLKRRYKVEVILHPPKVPYRETIKKSASGHGRHKKQTGGRGQFADCRITIEPVPRGEDYQFVDKIFGGSIPQNYRPAVDKGIQEARRRGYLAGNLVVDFRVTLLDGQYHDVDSSEMAFKIAGSLAFKDAMADAGATILEPMMQVEIVTTDEFMGDIMGDLSQRRGRPQGMEPRGDHQHISATVPMAEMLSYAPALRSMTQGRSTFTMEFSHYEEAPHVVQEKIIAEYERKKAEKS